MQRNYLSFTEDKPAALFVCSFPVEKTSQQTQTNLNFVLNPTLIDEINKVFMLVNNKPKEKLA